MEIPQGEGLPCLHQDSFATTTICNGPRFEQEHDETEFIEKCVSLSRILSGIVSDLETPKNGPDGRILEKLLYYLRDGDQLMRAFADFSKDCGHDDFPEDDWDEIQIIDPEDLKVVANKNRRIRVLKNPFTAHRIFKCTFHNALVMMIKIQENRHAPFPAADIPDRAKLYTDHTLQKVERANFRTMVAVRPKWTDFQEQDDRPAQVKKYWPNPVGGFRSLYDLSWDPPEGRRQSKAEQKAPAKK